MPSSRRLLPAAMALCSSAESFACCIADEKAFLDLLTRFGVKVEKGKGGLYSGKLPNIPFGLSLRFTDGGRAFLQLLGASVLWDQNAERLIDNLPPHCIRALAEAVRSAANDQPLAQSLEQLAEKQRKVAEALSQNPNDPKAAVRRHANVDRVEHTLPPEHPHHPGKRNATDWSRRRRHVLLEYRFRHTLPSPA